MSNRTLLGAAVAFSLALLAAAGPSHADLWVQCPGDTDGDAVIDTPDPAHPDAVCMHLSAGDGLARMADGKTLYTFGFSDVTGVPLQEAMHAGMMNAQMPAPTIALDEGDEFYLTLSNVGMFLRPDLFDPHTVHFHGFPQASAIFDGVPDVSISINMMESLTYYYKINDPGTYMYHCHVEATEHMEMGMLGNLHVRPAQNRLPDGTVLGTWVHRNPDWNTVRRLDDPLVGTKYVYNDGDGSTRYDVEYPILLEGFDDYFHTLHFDVQPLPFASLRNHYPLINGRGYPDTINTAALAAPDVEPGLVDNVEGAPKQSQKMGTLIEAVQGQKVLLRIANIDIKRFITVGTTGLPMKVVGKDAKLLRGPTGKNLSYTTYSLTLGGGEAADAIIDTATVAPGEYYFYATNLDMLNNNQDRFGGMMTKIVVSAP